MQIKDNNIKKIHLQLYSLIFKKTNVLNTYYSYNNNVVIKKEVGVEETQKDIREKQRKTKKEDKHN